MSTQYSPKIVTDGLVLMLDAANPKSYPGSGNIWYDLSGNVNHGTINSGEYYGGYLRNVGNTSNFFSVDIPDSTSLSNTFITTTGGWTIEEIIWTNSVAYPEADAGSNISNGYGAPAVGFDWQHATGPTQFRSDLFGSSLSDSVVFSVSSPYNSLNEWRIRTIVWNRGTNKVILYINGNYIGEGNTPNTSGQVIYNGGGISLGTLYGWKHYGRRSGLKIYNKVLTSAEILQNYNTTKKRFGL